MLVFPCEGTSCLIWSNANIPCDSPSEHLTLTTPHWLGAVWPTGTSKMDSAPQLSMREQKWHWTNHPMLFHWLSLGPQGKVWFGGSHKCNSAQYDCLRWIQSGLRNLHMQMDSSKPTTADSTPQVFSINSHLRPHEEFFMTDHTESKSDPKIHMIPREKLHVTPPKSPRVTSNQTSL